MANKPKQRKNYQTLVIHSTDDSFGFGYRKKNTIITDHTLIIDELETSIKFHNLNFILGFLPKG